MPPAFADPDVAKVFANYPDSVRPFMLTLRGLVFTSAAADVRIGPLHEMLKWGEPAYLTQATRSGSTVRMDWKPRSPEICALYFNCQTTLVDGFRTLFSDELRFEGNRAVVLPMDRPLPEDAVRTCIHAALTYHLKSLRPGNFQP